MCSLTLTVLRQLQILEVTVQQFHYGNDVLKASARHGSLDTFNTVSEILQTKLDLDQVSIPFLTHHSAIEAVNIALRIQWSNVFLNPLVGVRFSIHVFHQLDTYNIADAIAIK